MDQITKKKWTGKHDINASILDYSTLSNIMFDQHQIFATDRLFSELLLKIFRTDWSD